MTDDKKDCLKSLKTTFASLHFAKVDYSDNQLLLFIL